MRYAIGETLIDFIAEERCNAGNAKTFYKFNLSLIFISESKDYQK